MPLPSSKQEIIQNLEHAYRKLDGEFDLIKPEYERMTDIEGGVSCCDIIAYQIGWGNLLLSWEKTEQLGGVSDMPAKGFKWNELGALADSFYQEYRIFTLPQLRQEFAALYQQLLTWLNALTEEELLLPHKRQWTGEKWAIMKWVQVNTAAPYQSARTKVRRWKREQNIL